MSLDKSIDHGKEFRKPYRGVKAHFKVCRNHGSCDYCQKNRLHNNKKRTAHLDDLSKDLYTELWSKWPQWERPASESSDKHWFSKSFLFQMANIDSELQRIFQDKAKLERIRTNRDYVGEPQVIQHVFEIIKRDPKNIPLLQEVELAEQELFSFLSGASDGLYNFLNLLKMKVHLQSTKVHFHFIRSWLEQPNGFLPLTVFVSVK